MIQLACDEELRFKLGENLKKYLEQVVSWEVVADQYAEAYSLARYAKRTCQRVKFPPEF